MDMRALAGDLRQRYPQARNLCVDSRQVRAGDIFLAMPGREHDGRRYIADAVAGGAVAILWEPEGYTWPATLAVPQLPISGLRAGAGALASAWWDDPSRALWMVGITGTNGKTSCSHWLAEAFIGLGRRTAVIGTLGNGFPDALAGTSHTTPDAVALQGLLAAYRGSGATGVAMEVSSHALDQGRVDGVAFDVAVLTNLSRDHLDYHGDMAAYAHAKARLFDWPDLGWAILNLDDDFGQRLYRDCGARQVRRLGYGLRDGEVRGEILRLDTAGLRMRVATPWGGGELVSRLIGGFNAENLLACLSVLLASGVGLDQALAVLAEVRPVAGRMHCLGGGTDAPLVVVDYAHTPDALEKTLTALREVARGELICVFGCGGGRDRGKRPLMGEVAARLADRCLVTSDNPRNEDPQEIIAEVLAGMPAGQPAIADRASAIVSAVGDAKAGDVVLIAGKGHEDYQEIHGERHPFSDLETAGRALAARRETHAPV